MSGVIGGSAPRPPAAPPSPPKSSDPEIEQARLAVLREQRQRAGRAATLLTGGASSLGAAPTAKPTLLSGTA